MTYKSTTGHTFTTTVSPIAVHTADDLHRINPGSIVADEEGLRFAVLDVRTIRDGLQEVVLLQISEEVQP